jgi:hypothetical protein
MANDINDDAELIPNHNEAWSLAHFKRGTSNLARAYVELRDIARKIGTSEATNADRERMIAIIHANDL